MKNEKCKIDLQIPVTKIKDWLAFPLSVKRQHGAGNC